MGRHSQDPHHQEEGHEGPPFWPGKALLAGDADAIPAQQTPALPLLEAGEEGEQREFFWQPEDFQSLLGMRKAFTLISQYSQT